MRKFIQFNVLFTSFVLMMFVGSFSYAHDTVPGAPNEQVTQEKPATKTLPEGLTANLNTSFYSKYVWRGLELSKESLVIFPSATIGYKGFALNVWVDLDTNYGNPPPGNDSEANLQETDLTLTYTNSYEPWKMDYTLGWIYYDTDGFYGDTPTDNQEIFVSLAFDVLLKPTLSVYTEIQTGEAWYVSLALAHSFQITKKLFWDVGGWVSFLDNEAEDFSALHDGNLWTSLTVPLNSYFSVTPKIQYSFPLSSDSRDRIEANSFDGKDANFLYGGLSVDYKF